MQNGAINAKDFRIISSLGVQIRLYLLKAYLQYLGQSSHSVEHVLPSHFIVAKTGSEGSDGCLQDYPTGN